MVPTSSAVNSANSCMPVIAFSRAIVGAIVHTLPTMWSKLRMP